MTVCPTVDIDVDVVLMCTVKSLWNTHELHFFYSHCIYCLFLYLCPLYAWWYVLKYTVPQTKCPCGDNNVIILLTIMVCSPVFWFALVVLGHPFAQPNDVPAAAREVLLCRRGEDLVLKLQSFIFFKWFSIIALNSIQQSWIVFSRVKCSPENCLKCAVLGPHL